MPRIYTNYLNNGEMGVTWFELVGASLMLQKGERTTADICLHIMEGKSFSLSLQTQVGQTLKRLVEAKFVVRLGGQGFYTYMLTGEGRKHFKTALDKKWSPKKQIDSKLLY